MFVLDDELRFQFIAGEALTRNGWDVRSMLGRRPPDVMPPWLWRRLRPGYEVAAEGRRAEIEAPSADGRRTWRSGSPLPGDGASAAAVLVIARDVTEQRLAQEALARSERELRMLAEHASDVLARLTPDGVYLYVSPACEQILGYTQSELIGTSAFAYFAPDDRAERRRVHAEILAAEGTVTTQSRRRHKSGRLVWVESTVRAVRDEDGEVVELCSVARDVTQRLADEELRRQWEASFRFTARGISITDPETGIISSVNPEFARMHGGAPADYAGKPLASLFAVPERIPALSESDWVECEAEHVRADGSTFPVRTEVVGSHDEHGRALHRVAHYTDITEERHRAAAAREAAERFERVFDRAPIGMLLVDPANELLRANGAMHELLGYEAGTLEGMSITDITVLDDLPATLAVIARLRAGEIPTAQLEKRFARADGSILWAHVSAAPVFDEEGAERYRIVHVLDITERKRMEESLHHLADHDSLTGLWNRRRFTEELERRLAWCRRYAEDAVLVELDLDNFKLVNDALGHAAGDEVLRRVAEALALRVRPGDSLCRVGGDEFAVLLVGVTPAEAERRAQEICAAIRPCAMVASGHPVHATVSAGAVSLADYAGSAQEIFIAADLAMYEAKRSGRNRAVHHRGDTHGMRTVNEGLRLAARLREAIASERLVIYAQPIFDLQDGTLVMHELLVRMIGEDGGLVAPGVFLSVAERFGLMRDLDRWMIERAAELAGARPGVRLAVNLSGRSLTDAELADHIEDVFSRHGAAPSQLIFEVTETEAIANIEQAQRLGKRLRAIGCEFALDDFGAGFSSFAYLKALPLDYLKIDGEFVRELLVNPTDRLLVRALQDVASGMGKRTVAEFVSDEPTRELLRELGVDYGQGFHLGHPLPVAEALDGSGCSD